MADYNFFPEDRNVIDSKLMRGQTHCTDEELQPFRGMLGHGLHEAFRLFERPSKSRRWRWWGWRNLASRAKPGCAPTTSWSAKR